MTTYTKEIIDSITTKYLEGTTAAELATMFPDFSERSIIAKLSSLGIYKKKTYLNKRGEMPTKKEEYISRIATLLDLDAQLLESLEKVTKTALILMEKKILDLKST